MKQTLYSDKLEELRQKMIKNFFQEPVAEKAEEQSHDQWNEVNNQKQKLKKLIKVKRKFTSRKSSVLKDNSVER